MKSKCELLRSLIGKNNVAISDLGEGSGIVISVGADSSTTATSTIDEVGEEMIHSVTPRYKNLQRWIAIDWIAEIRIRT